jgi:hypothetical protein
MQQQRQSPFRLQMSQLTRTSRNALRNGVSERELAGKHRDARKTAAAATERSQKIQEWVRVVVV